MTSTTMRGQWRHGTSLREQSFIVHNGGEAKKKNVEFPLTRPTLFYGPDPTDFIGKFVYTELRGQYKTVKPLSGDCKNAGHWTILMRSSLVEFHSAVSEEKSKMSQPIRGQGSHLVFPIGPKNTNLVEDVEILLPVKFRWIPFSGFSGEVENVSANQRPGRPSCFSDRPEKHKLGRGRWDLAYCQVSLNSVQRFQRRSQKCLSKSEARAAILFFRSARKTQTW